MNMILCSVILILLVGLDQLTKALVSSGMTLYESFPLIPGVINITYVRNSGAAWGILSDSRWVFMTITTIAIAVIVFALYKFRKKPFLFLFSLTLLLGGGIGNMIDRIFYGTVIDMIEAAFINFPVFNIADCCVTCGAVLLFIYVIFIDKSFFDSKKTKNETDAASGEDKNADA